MATAGVHGRLEARLGVMDRLADPARRASLWSAFYGFYAPTEAALAPWLARVEGLDAAARRKAPALERDLERMGLGAEARAALPRRALTPMGSIAQAMGATYVLEGATLGGRAILKAAARLRIAPDALSFYDVYGPETGAMWRRFCAALERTCAAPAEAAIAASAAVETFTAIETWLCDTPEAATHADTRAA